MDADEQVEKENVVGRNKQKVTQVNSGPPQSSRQLGPNTEFTSPAKGEIALPPMPTVSRPCTD